MGQKAVMDHSRKGVIDRFTHEQTESTYEFIDRTERLKVETLSINEFEYQPELGRSLDVSILVKWTNQRYHDENLRSMFTCNWDDVAGISRTNAWRHRNRYYDGLIARASLDTDMIDDESVDSVVQALQPSGMDSLRDGTTAYACADKILVSSDGDPSNIAQTISHPTFARLHSVQFSPDGRHMLTASSSLDLVHELDMDGNIVWSFDAWSDTPYNTNKLGQQFFRDITKTPYSHNDVLRNPDPSRLKDEVGLRDKVCVVDNPEIYNNLGLPTNLTPVFINGASYGPDGQILVTSFHRGEAWSIDPSSRQVIIVAKDMGSPHGLHYNPDTDGYLVTDTKGEKVRFIDPNMDRETVVDLSMLGERKPGLERVKWLQYTTRLNESLFCAVIAPRQRITLFDPVRRLRRDIPFDPEWGIQLIKSEYGDPQPIYKALGTKALPSDLRT